MLLLVIIIKDELLPLCPDIQIPKEGIHQLSFHEQQRIELRRRVIIGISWLHLSPERVTKENRHWNIDSKNRSIHWLINYAPPERHSALVVLRPFLLPVPFGPLFSLRELLRLNSSWTRTELHCTGKRGLVETFRRHEMHNESIKHPRMHFV